MRILLKNPVMKGLLALAAAAAVLGLWFLARNGDDALADAKTDIVIQRDSFLAQVDAIHADPDSYVGKSITIQGLCGVVRMGEISYHLVYRVDPGCCGDDGPMHGFSFIGGGDAVRSGRWITVTGRPGGTVSLRDGLRREVSMSAGPSVVTVPGRRHKRLRLRVRSGSACRSCER